jgi:hypothetical protein
MPLLMDGGSHQRRGNLQKPPSVILELLYGHYESFGKGKKLFYCPWSNEWWMQVNLVKLKFFFQQSSSAFLKPFDL